MASPTTDPDPIVGQTFSHYRVLARIGGGGMGLVYEAEDLKLHRHVALKFLPNELVRDEEMLARFNREAEAASALNHPNICTIYDIDSVDGKPFIAMELLEGATLKQRITDHPLENETLIHMGLQVASALVAAHAKDVVHRDIKSSNIFVTKNGQAKLLDFGLAKLKPGPSTIGDGATASDDHLTQSGSTIGTFPYMSPEQVRGKDLDARSDLFSFGVVLYEMASGKLPFRGETLGTLSSAILDKTPTAPVFLNPDLRPELQEIINKALQKDPNLRYQSATEIRADLERLRRQIESGVSPQSELEQKAGKGTKARIHQFARKHWKFGVVGTLLALAIVAAVVVSSRRVIALSEKDTVLIADFENKTGDGVFDDTLRQALTMDLAQSPFLNVLSDRKVTTTLALMGRPPDSRVVGDVARELCERVGSKALIAGSISSVGTQYVLGLRAINCGNGDMLVVKQARADRKEDVLKALDKSASELRKSLGESLASVQKFATPVEEVTTPSLEALKAYTIGRRTAFLKGDAAGLPYHLRAVEIDPNFAVAYSGLAVVYGNLGQATTAAKNARKAYELRERVSEREKYSISTFYYEFALGDIDQATRTYELWTQTYPNDGIPLINLGNCYMQLGQWEKALRQTEVAIRMEPNSTVANANLAWMQVALNRSEDAINTGKQALARNLDAYYLRIAIYDAAFIRGDRDTMNQQLAWASGRSGEEDWLLATQADTEAFHGRLRAARDYSNRATDSARRANAPETAALWQASAALREAEFGNTAIALREAKGAMAMFSGRDVKIISAMALARAGDSATAQKIASGLDEQFPHSTTVQGYWLPSIRAATEMRTNPQKAIEILRRAAPYEMGQSQPIELGMMYPIYLRGSAYLRAGMGTEAAIEFQKILDSPGIVLNFHLGALANLQAARAYAMAGDRMKARIAYQKFLQLWSGADPDVPVLIEAKAEFAGGK